MRWLTVLPIAALTGVVLLAVLAPAVTQRISLPVAMVGLLIGVPHGAVDHLVPRWTDMITGRMATGWLIVAYMSVATLAAGALVAVPTVAVLTFLLMSAVHFGTAESAFDEERFGRCAPRPWSRPLESGSHGAVVVGLLLWVHPQQVDPWLRLLSPGAAAAATAFRAPGLLLTGALVLAQVVVTIRRIRTVARAEPGPTPPGVRMLSTGAVPLVELAVLVTAFAIAPPLIALGVYFGCWHALRHTGRLLDVARRPEDRDWRMPARRLLTASLLPTVAALGTMAGLVLVGDRAPVVLEVSVLLALTFPHSALVWFVDARRPSPGATGGRPQRRGVQTGGTNPTPSRCIHDRSEPGTSLVTGHGAP